MSSFIVDAQLPPALARMLSQEFGLDAVHVVDVGLGEAKDTAIAAELRRRGSVIVSKDHDFIAPARSGQIPGLVLLTCGNVTNARLREIMSRSIIDIVDRLAAGELVIEVTG